MGKDNDKGIPCSRFLTVSDLARSFLSCINMSTMELIRQKGGSTSLGATEQTKQVRQEFDNLNKNTI